MLGLLRRAGFDIGQRALRLARTARVGATALVALALIGVASAAAQVAPDFSKAFSPASIGAGSASTLTFTIVNGNTSPVTSLAFTDVLPAGVTIADPASASTTCTGATLSAPDGGGTITFSDGAVAGSGSCTVSVNVTSSVTGTHTNTSGDLTSSAGNSGPASADLNVVSTAPGFTKAFAPSSVALGSPSTLTFTFDNTASASNITQLSFTDNLPTGLVVASPSNASTTCGGTSVSLSATPGGTSIGLTATGINFSGFEVLTAGSTCTVTADVMTTDTGALVNVTGNLSYSTGGGTLSAGKATATLDVTGSTSGGPILSKSFTDDPATPGGTATLQFTIRNPSRDFEATSIAFTDDLDAVVSGLASSSGTLSNVCGSGSQISGTSNLSFTGGTLAAGDSCTLSVTVAIPGGATSGTYTNTTSQITAMVNGSPTAESAASDFLTINAEAPALSKTFVTNPVAPGGTVTMEFTVTRQAGTSPTAITFLDSLTPPATRPIAFDAFPSNPCGAGSSISVVNPTSDTQGFQLNGGHLDSTDEFCTFQVSFTLPTDATPGDYVNTTSAISATVGASTVTGGTASDTLTVSGSLSLTLAKSFTNDPVLPGGTVNLRFTLENSGDIDAGSVGFTDDLDATLSGLVATGLPTTDVCGTGSQISGTSTLTLSGATLASGDSCTFDVTLQVPGGASVGTYPNTTSDLTATPSGGSAQTLPSTAASDSLVVSDVLPPVLTKSFTDDPVVPGGTVTLEFTLTNQDTANAATGMSFSDNLSSTLSGLASTSGTVADPCGSGSQISGTTTLVFTGGNLAAGDSCTFSVSLAVPTGAAAGNYPNTTSNVSATVGATATSGSPASDVLAVETDVLLLTKSFTDDPVVAGNTVTLHFDLTNSSSVAVSGITFTDDLDATLSGLVATGLPMSNVCGAGSQISGTSTLTLTGGDLADGGNCAFDVTLQVPGGASSGSYSNTTSAVSGTATGGGTVGGGAASDSLSVTGAAAPTFTKSFTNDPVGAGSTVTLQFTIDNPAGGVDLAALGFTDDLDSALSGLVATGLPMSNVCGAGSEISGTSSLVLSGGNVTAGSSCTFSVTLQVPSGAAAGTYPNTTSSLFEGGMSVASAATDSLVVVPPPTFAKAFGTSPVGVGVASTLTFTIDNSASSIAANSLAFTDNLPSGLVVATPANGSTTCTGGTVTGAAGATAVSLSGGSVAGAGSCTVSIDVSSATPGSYVNVTGNLTSSLGNSGTATDTLDVQAMSLTFAKVFGPDTIGAGTSSTLTFTINNSANAAPATSLDFSDTFPSGLVVATPANAVNTCTGGTFTASDGAGSVGYTGGSVAASASCTLTVDVTAASSGSYVNVTGNLTSSFGNSGTASDALTVVPPPTFTKAFGTSPVGVGVASTLTFTIDNSGATIAANSLAFTDNLPAGLVVATPANASTTCTSGTVTGAAGASAISLSGGSVAGSASCTVTIDVSAQAPGTYINTSGNLTSSLGNSGTATDTLSVQAMSVGFSKAFGTNPADVGTATTLTFTIDNSTNAAPATSLDFTDPFPAGLVVATPANASTTCTGGTLTASTGATSVSYSGGTVSASSSCTVSVDVTADAVGSYVNTTGMLTSSLGSHGTASDTLTVQGAPLGFAKAFAPASVGVGAPSTLTFTIDNTANAAAATNIAFTDTFPSGLVVAATPNASNSCSGGSFTATAGSGAVSYSGGGAPASATCTLTVDVSAATTGSYVNVTGDLTSDFGNSGTASATLSVGASAPGFTKVFTPDSIIVGSVTTLTFTIDNSANAADATALTFTDALPASLTVATPANASTTCTGGTLTATAGGSSISYSGGSVAASGSCTVQADVQATAVGSYTNTSGTLSSSFGTSGAATATLNVNQDPAVIIAQTQEVIRNFMNTRANLITIQEPGLTSHLDGPAGSSLPVDVSARYDPEGTNFAFSTSLSRLAYAAGRAERNADRTALNALGYLDAAEAVEPGAPRFDIWAEGTFTTFNDTAGGVTMDGTFGLLYLGGEYRLRSNLLVGVMGQFDWTDENDDSTDIGVNGKGWLAGPYVVGRLGSHVYVQARGAWGTSSNDVTPFGTYTDTFDTTRWLASGKIEGRFLPGNWRISPTAGLIYFQENQESYTDSNGLTIPSQTVSLGRVTVGPEVGYRMRFDDGGYLEPSLGVTGVWDFDEDATSFAGAVTSADALRARVNGGFTLRGSRGAAIEASGFYDGLGDQNFEAYGGKLKVTLPFQ